MKTFQCTQCGSLVFFNDLVCVTCHHALGFDPEVLSLRAVGPEEGGDIDGPWRFCRNHADHQACNFLVAADDPDDYCVSCRQTRVIPNLEVPGNRQRWATIEHAKRRLYYTLAKLGLENARSSDAPLRTPVYEFREDVPGEEPVMTGHANGLITLNIAEADDTERTRRRTHLHEPYRTLLGHLRHEVGHFYWDLFFPNDSPALEQFRQLFGDERTDYGQALQRHYASGPPADWPAHHVSSYATMHPWEDWAETWAHYLHLMDLLETAAHFQMQFSLQGPGEAVTTRCQDPYGPATDAQTAQPTFTELLSQGMATSLVLNSLNRSLGQDDAYPFALSTPVLEKLGFVHEVVRRQGVKPPASAL